MATKILPMAGHRPAAHKRAPLRIVTRYYLGTKLKATGKLSPIETKCWQAMTEKPMLDTVVVSPMAPRALREWLRVVDGESHTILFRTVGKAVSVAHWCVLTAKVKGGRCSI